MLIVRLSALGDVAMTIPQVYSVCNKYPDTTFVILTQKIASNLFVNAPANLQVCVADVKARHKGVLGVLRLAREMNALGIDAVADLHDVLRTQLLRFFLQCMGKPAFVIDKGRREKRQLVAQHNKCKKQLTTSAQRYANVFHRMNFHYTPTFRSIYGNHRANEALFAHITPGKSEGEQWVGIAPFAKHQGKIYPLDRMEQVVETLSRNGNVRIFLFGAGAEEAAILGAWRDKYRRVTSLADTRNGFSTELALISHLDVMLAMDSANMHLAALTHTPVVTVWGATHRYAGFLGYEVSPQLIVEQDIDCRPCSIFGNKPCHRGDYACLRQITPEQIIATLNKVLKP